MMAGEPKKSFEQDYHRTVADELIQCIRDGTAPWQKPWEAGTIGTTPFNPESGTVYAGLNNLVLTMRGYNDPRWMTYKQAAAVGAQVRKGEKGTRIEFYKFTKREPQLDDNGQPVLDANGKAVTQEVRLERPIHTTAVVFNAHQMDGYTKAYTPRVMDWSPVEEAEQLLAGAGVEIRYDQRDQAFFRVAANSIHMPDRASFKSAEAYYATALHEVGHATGHDTRMARDFAPFGTEAYAREELRAEITSFMVARDLGIGHNPGQHAAYVENWVKILKDDPREIVRAARDAEKMASWIMEPDKRQELNLAGQKAKAARQERTLNQEAGTMKQTTPKQSPEREFADFCKDFGLKVDKVIADGRWHSVPLESDKGREKSGGYRAHFDGHANGWVKNHKTGEALRWVAMGQTLGKEEREQLRRDAEAIKATRQKEIAAGYEKTAKTAYGVFENAGPAPEDHPYLLKKGIRPLGLKATDENTLLVPVRDINGKLMSLQFINEEGEKRFLTGGQKHGGMLVMDPKMEIELRPVIIAEGYATAASICESLKEPVVVAFDAGNLKPVAEALRQKYPDKPLIIAADNDHSRQFNAGVEKASAAARATDAILVVPEFNDLQKAQGMTDFNDLHRSAGRQAVKEAFASALETTRTLKAEVRKEQRLEQGNLITF